MSRRHAWLWWLLGGAGLVLASRLAFRFPWEETVAALEGVRWPLLGAALLLNLLSPFVKGWAWHVLLGRVAPHRFWMAQEANLIGTAVNSLSVGVSGEAARIALIVKQDRVPVRAAALSVVSTRAVEALGLALFVVLAPFALELPAGLRGLQLGGAVALATALLLMRFRGWMGLVRRLPRPVRAAAAELAEMGWGTRLVGPTLLALASWVTEWYVYHLALLATHLPVSYAASFTALIAANLGGVLRVTPANVGVMQAAIVGALLPFGIAAEDAVAGGVALQAIEVLPILALALVAVGRSGLQRLMRDSAELQRAA